MTHTPQSICEGFHTNYDLLARILEAKRSQPTSTIRPTMTYRVDASREQMPNPKPITLHAPRWAVNP